MPKEASASAGDPEPIFHACEASPGGTGGWLEIILAATHLVAWPNSSGFTGHPEIARCEIATFRYRVLHTAARITRGARQLRLRIDLTWRWAQAIATAWHRIRAAFP
jgi:hypothetical protein